MKYVFRVEAVNFDPTIFDTNDLSTIRGMGLVMLKSPVREIAGFAEVYAGASTALWTFDAEDEAEAGRKAQVYETALQEARSPEEQEVHRHITFVSCWRPVLNDDFAAAHRATVAGCRWKQMEQPTLVYPTEATDKVCRVDAIRPATEEDPRPEKETRWVSGFTHARRRLGLDDKHVKERFYQGYVDVKNAPASYVKHLDQLTEFDGFGPRLNHKMAVIHLDGNGFGARAMKCGKDDLTAWSRRVKGEQDEFLRTLLRVTSNTGTKPGAWYWQEEFWRMEVLLWGGDDIAIVVPAWAGWWTVAQFFKTIDRANDADPLTYAAGLVFCHHNAPIRRARRLADDLAQRAKKAGKTTNRCAYQVLESFDDLGLDPDTTANELLKRAELKGTDMVVDGAKMQAMLDEMPTLQKAIPRSKAYDIVRLIVEGKDAAALIEKTLGKAERDGGDIGEGTKQFGLTNGKAGWLHLVELWDYLPEPTWKDPFDRGEVNA